MFWNVKSQIWKYAAQYASSKTLGKTEHFLAAVLQLRLV